jgi:hypothetical protein
METTIAEACVRVRIDMDDLGMRSIYTHTHTHMHGEKHTHTHTHTHTSSLVAEKCRPISRMNLKYVGQST